MKNQWMIWAFIAAAVVVVLFAFNYQSKEEAVSLNDLFSKEELEKIPDVEYEFAEEVVENGRVTEKAIGPAASSEAGGPLAVKPGPARASAPGIPEKAAGTSVPAVSSQAMNTAEVPFTIQVSSFKDRDRAETARRDLSGAGYPAFVVEKNLGDKGIWYRVYVGRFQTKNQADELLSKIKNTYEDSFVMSPQGQ